MMKHLFLIAWLFLLGAANIDAQKPYFIVFTEKEIAISHSLLIDDFDGSEVNQKLWYNYYPWGGLSIDANTYTDPVMCYQEKGTLVLKVDTISAMRSFPDWMIDTLQLKKTQQKLVDGKFRIERLTSALWSKEAFKYGYFECKAYLPEGKGYWPAFWLYGGKPNEEIDFIEAKGERDRSYHINVHCPNRCDRVKKWGLFDQPFGHWAKTKTPINHTWSTFSGLWTPEGVMFYHNQRLLAYHEAEFATSMNLIANFSLAKNNAPFAPGPDKKTKFPAEFRVDFIRAWDCPTELLKTPLAQLQDAYFIKVIPSHSNRIYLEFAPNKHREIRAWIEKDGVPFLEIDLSQENQVFDFTYWTKGAYTMRFKNKELVKEIPLIEQP